MTTKLALPSVSFIIPTLNAGLFLEGCLKAIRGQDYPAELIEIIVSDAGSTDQTLAIAKRHGAKVVPNPEILHEPGKTIGTKAATGELIFYTDADNILATKKWLSLMVRPYLEQTNILGFLPQTTAAPDSRALNRYLSYLFTDPLTWFIYGAAANPAEYRQIFQPTVVTTDYQIYQFTTQDHPLFGLSQGSGVSRHFKRGGEGHADDILSGIQLIAQGGRIAYVPGAKIYHYHVRNLADFIKKYRWRIRNNFSQQVKGMGLVNRLNYFNRLKKVRLGLFLPYSLTLILPIIDSFRLCWRWKSWDMLWHLPACLVLSWLIITEGFRKIFGLTKAAGVYGQ